MVFLRPKIIRSATDARPLTQELLNRARREDMLQSQRLTSKLDDYLSDTEQPVLSNDK
jgi:type II secretory pathway component GspD/PulD (secretin)